jgi:hypothetical protein
MTALSKDSERLLRDLKWCIASAPIVDSVAFSGTPVIAYDSHFWFQAAQAFGQILDDSSTPELLLGHVQKEQDRHRNKSLRLGIYFETLLEFWLARSEQFAILASHRHVSTRDADAPHSRTLGEVDWIVCNRFAENRRNEHWECALKFYLISQDGTDPEHLVGPDRQDTLARKLNHMVGHQLKVTLPEFEPTIPVCIIKGRVFIEWRPGNTLWATVTECAQALPLSKAPRLRQLSPNAEAGMVVHMRHFQEFHKTIARVSDSVQGGSELCYFLLAKEQWLSPLIGSDFCPAAAMDFEQLSVKFQEWTGRPVMIASCRKLNSSTFEEMHRFFLQQEAA